MKCNEVMLTSIVRILWCYGCLAFTEEPMIHSNRCLYCKFDKQKCCWNCLWRFQKQAAESFFIKHNISFFLGKTENDDNKQNDSMQDDSKLSLLEIDDHVRYDWTCFPCSLYSAQKIKKVWLSLHSFSFYVHVYIHTNRFNTTPIMGKCYRPGKYIMKNHIQGKMSWIH